MGRQKRKKCINCNKLQNTFINTSLAYFLPESTNLFLHIFKHSYWHICDIFITCLMVSSECLKCLLSKLYRDEAATFPDISNKTILVLVKSSPCRCSWTSVSSRKYLGMLSSKYVLLPALISFSSGDLLHSASNPFERRDRREETFAQSLISLDIKVEDISLVCFWKMLCSENLLPCAWTMNIHFRLLMEMLTFWKMSLKFNTSFDIRDFESFTSTK